MLTLSAALFVKNEQAHLERCIKSLCGFIPQLQIIIVDTGSTDDTVKIAKKYTKFVYEHPWQNDFAYHRNQSFAYCTGDWILQIDADEQIQFLAEANHQSFLNFLEKIPPQINAIGFPLKDWRETKNRYAAEFDVARIFRKDSTVWRRKIHNEPVYQGGAAYYPLMYLKHYGYDLTDGQMAAKANRTIPLLKESLENDPSDYESYFYLAQSHSAWLKDHKKALEYAEKYVDFKALSGKHFNPAIYHLGIATYTKLEDFENAMRWINMGLEHNVENIDVCYDLMQLGLAQKRSDYVAIGAQKYVAAIEKFVENRLKSTFAGQFFFTNTPTHYAMALHYLAAALIEKATVEYKKLNLIKKKCPDPIQNEITEKMAEFIKGLGWQRTDEEKMIITPDQFNKV